MEKDEILNSQLMELRRGTLVLCVLSQLNEPMYGYHLVKKLSQKGVQIEANTLYPLLRRLQSQGLLKSSWETGESKPRKYYTTTNLGKEIAAALWEQWRALAASMEQLWEENENDDTK